MIHQETTRSKKVAHQIQRDISEIFQKECKDLINGVLVSVTVVRMSPDFELAKVYLSVFPFGKHDEVLATIKASVGRIRLALGKRMRNTMRNIPELAFYLDDSLEYADNINRVMDGIVISPETDDDELEGYK
ncbi:MAG: 30S ribosome-binding factor RbfA [Rikenellaceae bacterium]